MKYKYGDFSEGQVASTAKFMHGEVHKLLLYKDENSTATIKNRSEEEFLKYFDSVLMRIGGMNNILGNPPLMVSLISTLEAAKMELGVTPFNYKRYRKLILDAHGYIREMFEALNEV